MPHTTDDDDRRYRPSNEVEVARQQDPVMTLADYLKVQGILTDEQLDNMRNEAQGKVDEATDAAEVAPPPDASTIHDHLFAN